MIKALIVSDNIHFVEKVVNEIGRKELDVNINHISTTVETAIACGLENKPDIVFSDTKISQESNSLLFKKYPDNLLIMNENDTFRIDILENIHNLLETKNLEKRTVQITKELTELGYNIKYAGTQFLIEAILIIYQSKNRKTANLQRDIFPIVAQTFNKTPFNVKASINRATDCMYAECNIERLKEYFHFSVDMKPTVKQVIFSVLEKL